MNIHKTMFPALIITLCLLAGCASVDTHGKDTKATKIERISVEELDRLVPKPIPNLTLPELVKLSKSGISTDEIIAQIKQSGTRYALTPSEAIDLHQQGVDSKVLDYLDSAQQQALRDSVADDINRREIEHKKQMDQLMQELFRRPYYYDPFGPAGYPYRRGYPGMYMGW